ncbi:MAG: AMP-binding protein [Longimicrobiaceae bacterium]
MSVEHNLAARLPERAALHPDRDSIVGARGERISFGELATRVATLAGRLRAAGVTPGERVLVFVPMSIELYVLLLACFHAGVTAVFLDAWSDRARLAAAVRAARPRLFVATPRAHLLRLFSPAVRRIAGHWWAGGGRLRRIRTEPLPLQPVAPEHPALVTFTTGSTGAPKAALRSHGFLLAQHRALAEHLDAQPGDVDMPTLPVFVLHNLAAGVPSVLPRFDPRRPARGDPARLLRQMRAERVTTSSGSPAFYDQLARHSVRTGTTLPLRALRTGGAPVNRTLARRLLEACDGRVTVVYGSTEAEPIATIDADELVGTGPPPDPNGPGWGICAGRPVRAIRMRLIRPHDGPVVLGPRGWEEWEVQPGEPGEVTVAGEHVLAGYLDAPEEERRNKVRDGDTVWHRTGDGARLDPAGRLWLLGPVAESFERHGRVWWSTPAEERALAAGGCEYAAYLGAAYLEIGGSRGIGAMLCVERSTPLDAVANAALRAALAPIPADRVVVLPRIPRDLRHASKTDYPALRRLLERAG